MEPAEWLTGALVIITGVYAWLTWRVVDETSKTRRQQVRPNLKLHVTPAGGGIVFPTVVSTGPGTALDVEVTLIGRHLDGDAETTVTLTRRYMAPHERVELLMPNPTGKKIFRYQEFAEAFAELRLTATMLDVLGDPHTCEDAIEDVPGWFSAWGGTWTRMTPDEAKRTADALTSIDKTLKSQLR